MKKYYTESSCWEKG